MNTGLLERNKIYKSVKNKKWSKAAIDSDKSMTMSQRLGISSFLSDLISSRNIEIEHALNYLEPKLKDFLPSPLHLLGMQQAIEEAVSAIVNDEKITIFGDYDVDGATSSSLLKRLFKSLGANVDTYIPDRIIEGYGPNNDAFAKLEKQGTKLIITVDCGTSAHESIALANDLNMKVIVIDHHIGPENLPQAAAIINPNRADELSDYKYLAAVGVCFLFAVGLIKHLREIEFFQDRPEPNLIELLDLVALGTICDQVPLTGLNRALVRQGLKVINNRKNIGLKALLDASGLSHENITVYHLGFVIGPRINAGGRVGKASLGTDLLANEDYNAALEIAKLLNDYNEERKAIEFMVLREAIELADKIDKSAPIIFVAKEGWHPGVIGIVASRLKDKYNKPVAVVALENGIGKASCRSISGIDFGAAVISAKNAGLLLAGGGHSMAAGFTVSSEKIIELNNFLASSFEQDYSNSLKDTTNIFDHYLTLSSVDVELINMIEKLGPFGTANYQPRFMITGANVIRSNIVGGEHISCILGEGKSSSSKIKAIAFRALNSPIGEVLLSNKRFNLGLIVNLNINRYNGNESAEMIIHDLIIEE